MKNRLLASPSYAERREPGPGHYETQSPDHLFRAPSLLVRRRSSHWPTCAVTRAALLFAASAICAPLQAENIPIVNPSFEDIRGNDPAHFDATGRLRDGHGARMYFDVADTSFCLSASPFPGWQMTASGGVQNPPGGAFSAVPDGQNAAFLNPRSVLGHSLLDPAISQVLCQTLAPGHYTLKFSVGRYFPDPAVYAGYRVQLLAGTNIIAQQNNVVVVNPGTFASAQIIVDVPTDHSAIGQLLKIRLGASQPSGTDAWVYFDNISLDGPPSPCVAYANSVADFSYTQGMNNWFYGYYSLTDDLVPGYDSTNDFSLLPNPHGYVWGNGGPRVHGLWNIGANFWTGLGAVFGLPNSGVSNAGRTLSEQWVVRRWVSEVTGLVRIRGLAAMMLASPDGSIAGILLNGRTIYERRIDNASGEVDYSVPVGLKQGDFVDFVLKAGGNIDGDPTYFTAIIEPAPHALDVATAVEVATPTVPAQRYHLHFSTDLQNWRPVGNPFTGTGETMYFFFSLRELGAKGFFKAETLP